jgi:hypothetical protein
LDKTHPAAVGHLPAFITGPGQTDYLFVVTVVLVIGAVLLIGNLYLRIHALPEHMAHRGNKIQLEVVSVLALLALFTHIHLFWIAALLLAFIPIPDFSTPISSMAQSLEKIAGSQARRDEELEDGRSREPMDVDRHREVGQADRSAGKLEAVRDTVPPADRQQGRG